MLCTDDFRRRQLQLSNFLSELDRKTAKSSMVFYRPQCISDTDARPTAAAAAAAAAAADDDDDDEDDNRAWYACFESVFRCTLLLDLHTTSTSRLQTCS